MNSITNTCNYWIKICLLCQDITSLIQDQSERTYNKKVHILNKKVHTHSCTKVKYNFNENTKGKVTLQTAKSKLKNIKSMEINSSSIPGLNFVFTLDSRFVYQRLINDVRIQKS